MITANKTLSAATKILFCIGIVAAALGANYLLAAWQSPPADPPSGNVDAPINVGTQTQDKEGALTLLGLGVFGPFQVFDGTQATGSVLMSTDWRGNAEWVATSSLGLGEGSGGSNALFHVQHKVAGGTNGGTLTGGAWRTRPLNTVIENDIGPDAYRSGSQIHLPAGTYTVIGRSEVGGSKGIGNHQARLQNISNGTTLLVGSQGRNSRGDNDDYAGHLESWIFGEFTLNSDSTIELQHQSQGNGYFGLSSSFGPDVVYADLMFWSGASSQGDTLPDCNGGDIATYNDSNGLWECSPPPGSGGFTRRTAQTANGSSGNIQFTNIPPDVSRIVVMVAGLQVQRSGYELLLQIGDSGSFESSGYEGHGNSSGFVIDESTSLGAYEGVYTLDRLAGNTWVAYGSFGQDGASKTLSGTLDRVRIYFSGGNLMNGTVNIMYQ